MAKQKPDLQSGNLTYHQKAKVIEYKRTHPKATLPTIAKWLATEFRLAKPPSDSCISRTLNNQSKYASLSVRDHAIRRTRVVSNQTLEKALVIWVLQKQYEHKKLTVEAIRQQGYWFIARLGLQSTITFLNGWYHAFSK